MPFREPDMETARVGRAALECSIREEGFGVNWESGRIDVRQQSASRPEDYDDAWWNRPGVKAFRRLTPQGAELSRAEALLRSNDVGLCWPLDTANVACMARFVMARLHLPTEGEASVPSK
mmetsp:Transcript_76385/g.177281  ORF Transcript_76385/g.177281 Transcript_76385/m.177281 type:complete len:120 (-) Transcript_76385:97-456(-)